MIRLIHELCVCQVEIYENNQALAKMRLASSIELLILMNDPTKKTIKKKLLDFDIFINNMNLDSLKELIVFEEIPQVDKFFSMVNNHIVVAIESKIEELQTKEWNGN